MAQLFVLFEHASGYGLFKVVEFEEVGAFLPQVEAAIADASKFQTIVKLVGFKPFTSAASALENINAISEGLVTPELSAFLQTNLPPVGKKSKIQLGVCDVKLAVALNEALGVPVTHLGVVQEIIRGIRQNLTSFVKGLTPASTKQAELGLGHSYSRGKVKFNVNRADNMIIQSISIIDQLDKDINTFAMRMKEWYSYHFPELAKLVTDNYQYSLCADIIRDRKTMTEEIIPKLGEIVMDPTLAQGIYDASKMSMGMDISPIDLMNIESFAKRLIGLSEYRKELSEYLKNKMATMAPNLACLIGDVVGARLISRSGSLTNLAKSPASTVQILGAEKALFRAIKSRSNTPKYGLIYHSSFISRAGATNKGRISRFLANKCSIACRIDCFSENLTTAFGEKLKEQVEERLKFYETGDIPRKNVEVMGEALEVHNEALKKQIKDAPKRKLGIANGTAEETEEPAKKKKKKKKKHQGENPEENAAVEVTETVEEDTPAKKKKKKNSISPADESMEVQEEVAAVEESPKKKKKKKKSLQPGEMDISLNGVQDSVEEPAQVNGGEVSPKKKKKKSLQPEEVPVIADEQEVPKKKKKKKRASLAEAD